LAENGNLRSIQWKATSMDRLEAMSLVLAVTEAGSLSAAARRLNTPVATASRKITELEEYLRVKLFDRSTRKLALTDAGATYVSGLKRVLSDLSEIERAASGEYSAPTGELIVTAPMALGRAHLMPIVSEFLKAYPDISMRLILGDRILSLAEEHIDVAIRIGVLPDSRLVARRVGVAQPVVCASSAYLDARGTPCAPEDLAAHDCIVFDSIHAPTSWSFHRDTTEVTISVRPRIIVSNIEDALEAALAGIGVTRAQSYQVTRSVAAGALRTVLDDYRPAPIPINLVTTAARLVPVKLRAFLDFASPRLKAQLASRASSPS
jgi:DNA-binding transcriptional LysR family regulator